MLSHAESLHVREVGHAGGVNPERDRHEFRRGRNTADKGGRR